MTRAGVLILIGLTGCVPKTPVPTPPAAEIMAPQRIVVHKIYLHPIVPLKDRTCAPAPKRPWGFSPAAIGGYIAALASARNDCAAKLGAVMKLK